MYYLARAVHLKTASEIAITDSHFIGNTGSSGGAISASEANSIVLSGNSFTDNRAIENGGVIYCESCTLALSGTNIFTNNSVARGGGALHIYSGILRINDSSFFSHNRAGEGGAIFVITSTVQTNANVTFNNNSDGAVAIYGSHIRLCGNIEYTNNRGHSFSALDLASSSIILCGRKTTFTNNTSQAGGAMQVLQESSVIFESDLIVFDGNFASTSGGAIYCVNGQLTSLSEPILSQQS